MIPRMTTVGTLKNYRYDLNRNNNTLARAMQTVSTRRNFNSYAEDPALAVRCFQIRRSYRRTESQLTVNDSLLHKYDVGWSALENVSTDLYSRSDDASIASILRSVTGTTGPGRLALGQSLCAKAQDIAQVMNGRYGENYVFSGADTLNPPFSWGPQINPEYDSAGVNGRDDVGRYLDAEGNATDDESSAVKGLYYRGVAVDSNDYEDLKKLYYFDPKNDDALKKLRNVDPNYSSEKEAKYIDVGLGHKEVDGEALSSTVFDSALQGIFYLGGYGTGDLEIEQDNGLPMTVEDVPRNVISIVNELGQILQRCNKEDGDWASKEDEQRFNALVQAYEDSESKFRERWTEMDTQSGFLKDNSQLLETTSDSLLQQYTELEEADPAAAIFEYMFAKYCYDAALKIGNSVLSQSLMDYMNF